MYNYNLECLGLLRWGYPHVRYAHLFFYFVFGLTSWATAHGWYRCALLSEPRLLNSISSGICRQNTQFNMYTTTSKQQGCTCKDSHPKCFITTNSTAQLSPGSVNRSDVHVLRESYTKVNLNTICNYFDFIPRNGLSLAIW